MTLSSLFASTFATFRLPAAVPLTAAGLSACYVVPLQAPPVVAPAGVPPAMAVAPVSQTFTARLYPANAEASSYGLVSGTVTNDLNGRGYFAAVIAGEQFQGEATRLGAGGGARSGMANAVGTRGGALVCRYTMNSSTQGTGSCVLNNGPAFTMHVGA